MVVTAWTNINAAFLNLLVGLGAFLPKLLIALVIFIVGWLVGAALGRVVAQVINSLRVDQALRAAGIGRIVSRAGFELSAGKFLGLLVEWFFVVVFLVASLQVLELTQVNQFLIDVVLGYLPRIISAVLILLVAAMVAHAAERVVAGGAKAANLRSAGFLGKVARYAIWVFAILAALSQLQVAQEMVMALFQGIVIAFSLAVGLAFGLGGQASAARYLENLHSEIKE